MSRLRRLPIVVILAALLGLMPVAMLGQRMQVECSMPCCAPAPDPAACCSGSGEGPALTAQPDACDCTIAPASAEPLPPAVLADSGQGSVSISADLPREIAAFGAAPSRGLPIESGLAGPPLAGARCLPRGRAPPVS